MNSEYTAVSDEHNGIAIRYSNSDPPLGDGTSDLGIGVRPAYSTSYSPPISVNASVKDLKVSSDQARPSWKCWI